MSATTPNTPDDRRQRLQRMVEQSTSQRKKRRRGVQLGVSAKAGRTASPRKSTEETKYTLDQAFVFEVYRENHPDVLTGERSADSELVRQLKEEINASGIARRDLYAFIGTGPDALFENENQAYNLEYGLRKRATITLSSARRWLTVLGKEIHIVFQDRSDGWLISLMSLQNAVADLAARVRSGEVTDLSQIDWEVLERLAVRGSAAAPDDDTDAAS